MNIPDKPSKQLSEEDDGRGLWWAIPAAVASVLGIAGSAIFRARRQQSNRLVVPPAPVETADPKVITQENKTT